MWLRVRRRRGSPLVTFLVWLEQLPVRVRFRIPVSGSWGLLVSFLPAPVRPCPRVVLDLFHSLGASVNCGYMTASIAGVKPSDRAKARASARAFIRAFSFEAKSLTANG